VGGAVLATFLLKCISYLRFFVEEPAQSSVSLPLSMEERPKHFMFPGTSTCESENRTKKQLAAHGDCSGIAD